MFYRNVKRTHADQYIYILHFFVLAPKRNNWKIFKSNNSKKPFLQSVCYWCDLLWWMFFVLCDNWESLFFKKVYRYSKDFSNCHAAAFFKRTVSKEDCILRYLLNNSTILQTSEIKFIRVNFGKISLTNLIFWLSLVTSTFFSQMIF